MNSVSTLQWQILSIFFTFLCASLDASLAKPITASYAQHCGSITPESSPTKLLFGASNSFLISNGFFSAETRINNHLVLSPSTNNSIHDSEYPGVFHFQPGQVHLTRDDGILQLEGTLVLVRARYVIGYDDSRRVVFKLSGFWSEAKGKLCMVGTGEFQPSQQDQAASALSVVLKLEFPKMSKITTSIIKGSIESIDTDTDTWPAHIEPISLLAYAQRRYQFSMTEQAEESCTLIPQEERIASESTSICFNLIQFMQDDSFTSSGLIDFLGFRFLSTSRLVCSEDGKVRLLLTLSNKTNSILDRKPLLPGKSLVAEGVWDHHNSKLCLVACGLNGKENNSSAVGDCSLGLTFWFPASFSLKQRSSMVGRMWNMTDNSINDDNKIVSLYSTMRYPHLDIQGQKYEYTELERVKKNCKIKNYGPKLTGRYPEPQSYSHLSFDLFVRAKNGRLARGNAQHISTGETYHVRGIDKGDDMYTTKGTTVPSSPGLADQNRTIWNVGYTITYTFWDENFIDKVKISAEGIYNSTMGTLCLVGCRVPLFWGRNGEILNSSARIDDRNLDCEFFIQLQLPSLDSRNEQGKGTITSTRANSDPLYIEPLEVTVSLMYLHQSKQESDRMDGEIIMVIASLSLLCACTYLQLRHARNNHTIRPLMSVTMLVVLTLGCMVTLILNTKAMFVPARNRQVFLQSGGWLDTNNTIMRLITMVTLLINFRLLQLAWGSRSKEEITEAISQSAEKKSLIFCVPLYLTGALVVWFVHSHFFKLRRSIFEDLARYVGLLVDNFLLPQIIFGVFSQSKGKVLNPFFYFGATAVRAVPHVYNAYRAWWYPVNFFNSSYIYANHGEVYYSKIMDIIIPFEGLLFALLVYLQQRFGGRCFLPKRFKNGASYEPVYVSDM
ncbi:uncharacterized protein LOC144563912 [Carex rostrata]